MSMSYLTFGKFLMEVRKVRPHELFELAHGRGASEPASAIPRAGAFEFSVSSRALQECQRRYFLAVFFAAFLAFLADFFFSTAFFFAARFFAGGFFGGFGLRKGIPPFSTLPSLGGGSLSPGASFKALSTLH